MYRGSCRRGLERGHISTEVAADAAVCCLGPSKLVGAVVATLQFQFTVAKQLDVEPRRFLDPFFWFNSRIC